MHPGRKGISGGVKCFHAFEKLHDTSKEGSKLNPVLQLASGRIRSANVPNHITRHLHAEKQGKSLTARLVVKLFRPAWEPIRVAYNGTTLVVLCRLSLYLPKPYKRQKVGPCLCCRRHSRSPSKSRPCLFPPYILTFIGGLGAPRPHRPLLGLSWLSCLCLVNQHFHVYHTSCPTSGISSTKDGRSRAILMSPVPQASFSSPPSPLFLSSQLSLPSCVLFAIR